VESGLQVFQSAVIPNAVMKAWASVLEMDYALPSG